MGLAVDRIARRERKTKAETIYVSAYDVINEITELVVRDNKTLVNEITLGDSKESALEKKIQALINTKNYRVRGHTRKELTKEVMDNIFGYGILQKFLDIEDCNGVFVNAYDDVRIRIGAKDKKTDISFGSEKNLLMYIRAISAKTRGEINQNSPLVKFDDKKKRLRIVAGIPPLAQKPFIVFRKHKQENLELRELVELGMLTQEMAERLTDYVLAGANIVFSGHGGAGKTTLMRSLIETLPEDERILVIEESPELNVKNKSALSVLVSRIDNGTSNLLNIMKMALLMSVKRIVYGEVKGPEAYTLFDGAFAGNYTMITTHSKSSNECIDRLFINVKKSDIQMNDEAIRDMLYRSVDVIVHLDSFRVTEICEVLENRTLNKLWDFEIDKREKDGLIGRHRKLSKEKSINILEKTRAVFGGEACG